MAVFDPEATGEGTKELSVTPVACPVLHCLNMGAATAAYRGGRLSGVCVVMFVFISQQLDQYRIKQKTFILFFKKQMC